MHRHHYDETVCAVKTTGEMVESAKRAVLKYRFATFSVIWVSWTLAIITYAVFKVFDDPANITANTVSALAAVIGIPPLFVGLIKWIGGSTKQ